MTKPGFPSLPTELVLHIASDADESSLLSLLLCNRALCDMLMPDLHTRAIASRGNQSAIQWATTRGHISLVKFLLSRGMHPDTGTTKTEPPALQTAVYNGRFDITELLLTYGADVNSRNYTSSAGFKSPIHIAAGRGDTGMIALLATHGADLMFRNLTGIYAETPLHVCVSGSHVGAVRMLLDLGVPVDVIDDDGGTSLDLATVIAIEDAQTDVWWNAMVEIGVMLVKAGAALGDIEVRAMEYSGQEGLREAEWRRILIAVKRDVSVCD